MHNKNIWCHNQGTPTCVHHTMTTTMGRERRRQRRWRRGGGGREGGRRTTATATTWTGSVDRSGKEEDREEDSALIGHHHHRHRHHCHRLTSVVRHKLCDWLIVVYFIGSKKCKTTPLSMGLVGVLMAMVQYLLSVWCT